MIRLIYDEKIDIEPEQKYIIGLLSGEMYDCADLRELTACVVGHDFLENQYAETDLHMRLAAAWKLRLQRVMMNEVEADLSILLSMSFCTKMT